ncbi:glycoside hydrolase [Dichomitus squalens LYAD-421 SS1]|uniref:glycoside hydrolase n=1 Tax=Dichomitus squalens (strain LYAD-421) TaxID=732165 RepID=UPI0004411618|nr:glycoside hydrolase [Dichomitus squalens LYAD-421 SS1]EJF67382.1 glycoside hydrolase [Dichomitus squalens LYAD-421 SS1]
MAEDGLRKRGRAVGAKEKAEGKKAPTLDQGKGTAVAASASLSKGTTLLVAVLFSVFAVFVYQDPSLVLDPINDFFGFEENAGILPPSTTFVADIAKRDAVINAFKHAWLAYERDAMGDDEYHPISQKGTNLTAAGGIGYTVIDSIDTMLLMGLQDEYARARKWVETKMSFDRDANFNTFETTIRVLGGLLSAYHFTKDELYLEKAKELADRIMPAFETPSGLPTSNVNLGQRKGVPAQDNKGLVSTAEVSTLQLEFRYLSYLTDNDAYWDAAENVMRVIKGASLTTGLASIFMNPTDGRFVLSPIRLGSRGDSYYEYLLKQYLQTNLTEPVYQDMYNGAIDGVHAHLIRKSELAKLTYTSELIPEKDRSGQISWRLVPKQDHLVCFFGGSLMLGAVTSGAQSLPVSVPPRPSQLTSTGKRDWQTGVDLIETCMRTHDTATGLSPEIAHFRIPSDKVVGSSIPQDWYIKGAKPGAPAPYDARYILRPETVESLFIAYRLTGDEKYRQYGWNIFKAIETHCKIETGGYASIINVDAVPVEHEDKMETFLMSETLKYLYLLFEDDSVLPLTEYVFNTEAHPFPIINPSRHAAF